MRTPALFARRGYAALAAGDTGGPARGEAGADGDAVYAELSAGGPDVNPELTGSSKHRVYDEMRKTDPTVKSALMFLKLPVRAAMWGLEPANADEPEAAVVRDFVAWNLGLEGEDGELDLSWDEQLTQALTMLDFGPVVEELVWGDLVQWRDKDGDPHLVRPLDRLAPRMPQTAQRVRFERGRIVEFAQSLPNTRPIPGEKLSYMVWEREAGSWDGVSVLRPMWAYWRLKKHLLITTGIGWDRFALGFPVVYHPDTDDGAATAKTIGRNIRSHERAYAHLPSSGPGPAGRPDSEWFIEILNAAATLPDPTPLFKFLSEQEAEAGMQQFTRQGLGQTGARATAEVQVDPYFLAVEALAHHIRLGRQRQVVSKLVEVNFGPDAAARWAPKLTVSKIQARNVQVLASALYDLSQAGVQWSDLPFQQDLRQMLGFPQLPDDHPVGTLPMSQADLLEILRGANLDPAMIEAARRGGGVTAPGLAATNGAGEGLGLIAP